MTWSLDVAMAIRDTRILEARIIDAMHPGQHVSFGWHAEIGIDRTADGFVVNGSPMDRAAALAQVAAFRY